MNDFKRVENCFSQIKYMVLWTTNHCNLKCVYCYADQDQFSHQRNMSLETALSAIKLPQSDFILQFSGGEPLLNYPLVEAVTQKMREQNANAKIQIQTNGCLITPDLAKRLSKLKIGIGISLDGPITVNEMQRGQTQLVIEGIKNLAAEGVYVNLNAVVTNESVIFLDKLVDLAVFLGNVKGIGLDLLRQSGRGSQLKPPPVDAIERGLVKMYERSRIIALKTGHHVAIREVEEAKQRIKNRENINTLHYCYASKGSALIVLPNGDLYPCGSVMHHEEYYMGNLKDSDTWDLKSLSLKTALQCTSCDYEPFCPGACPARSIVNHAERGTGSKYTPEDCMLRKTAFKLAKEALIDVKT